MIAAISPWRSLLFVPAHVQRFVESAHRRGADAVLLDLEDSVPAGQKAAARTALGAAVERLRAHGASVLVRVNRPLGECVADLSAAVAAGADAVVLPKTLGPDHVRLVDEHMAEREAAGGLRVGGIGLVAMIETVDALASVRD
ncbi:MAG: aldolase/citrate lyase family protein, partial [Ectothiorhodospiraceae bacterium]